MDNRLEQLTKHYEKDPSDPFCAYGIAMEHAKAKRYDQALSWLDKTLQLDPEYFYAYFQKGRVSSEMGKLDEARMVLEKGIAVADGKDDHARDEMTELLDSIGA